jgi:biopolymer transport protein ExbD
MVSAGSNAKEEELGIKLPGEQKGKSSPDQTPPIVLKISKDGTVIFNDFPAAQPEDLEMKGLQEKLLGVMAQSKETAVIISPDPDAKHERVIRVMDACSYAHVDKLAFRYTSAPK